MLGSADAFRDTRACKEETARKTRPRERKKRGEAEEIERREERSARRRARRKRAPGKGGEKIPCMHSCNTLPWSDCTSGNATPINHRRPRFFHSVRGEGSLLPSAWRENQEATSMSASTYLPFRDGDLINYLKEIMGKRAMAKILLKNSNVALWCIRDQNIWDDNGPLYSKVPRKHIMTTNAIKKKYFFKYARDWKE